MLKTLMKYIGQYKTVSIITALCTIGEVALETALPLVTAAIIDQGIEAGNLTKIFLYGGLMILMAAGSLCCGLGSAHFGAQAAMGFGSNLRDGMYRKIQTYSFSNIDKFSTAGLVTRLTTDVTNIQNAYMMLLRMCLRAPITLICAMVLSFMINPAVASAFLVAAILLGTLLVVLSLTAMKYFDQTFDRYDDLNASVQENVTGIRVVKAFVREDYEKKKFKSAAENIYKMFVKAEKIIAYNNPAMMLTIYSVMLILSWVSAHMIVAGNMTTGNLSSLLQYCMSVLMSLMMLSMVFVMLSMAIASARRIAEVLNEEPDLVNPPHPFFEVPDGSVDFSHVYFSYHKTARKDVLFDVDIHVNAGETIGIMGGTGTGKTSLVNLISRLYDVTQGKVMVGGHNVRDYDLETLRNEVSVVLQNNQLFSGTILENLRWGNENATEEECIEACKMACADEFIQRMPDGYNTHIEQGGTNVSGGQRQRLCIARALLKKPKVLILDDSTSAVDTATDAKIRKAFREQIPNTTKFIISQRVSSIEDADKIIVLEDGHVDGFGTHEELMENNEIYRSIYESQTQGSGDFDEVGGD
ncbi:MAG: ABC transporter ATP-binding protein/permease [Lachnospiraceae bacterium]|nr:ABC transporter ATP-binding protein/permease [Lachnospiraceae bacterium]